LTLDMDAILMLKVQEEIARIKHEVDSSNKTNGIWGRLRSLWQS
jgi:hypothetical protein